MTRITGTIVLTLIFITNIFSSAANAATCNWRDKAFKRCEGVYQPVAKKKTKPQRSRTARKTIRKRAPRQAIAKRGTRPTTRRRTRRVRVVANPQPKSQTATAARKVKIAAPTTTARKRVEQPDRINVATKKRSKPTATTHTQPRTAKRAQRRITKPRTQQQTRRIRVAATVTQLGRGATSKRKTRRQRTRIGIPASVQPATRRTRRTRVTSLAQPKLDALQSPRKARKQRTRIDVPVRRPATRAELQRYPVKVAALAIPNPYAAVSRVQRLASHDGRTIIRMPRTLAGYQWESQSGAQWQFRYGEPEMGIGKYGSVRNKRRARKFVWYQDGTELCMTYKQKEECGKITFKRNRVVVHFEHLSRTIVLRLKKRIG